jgi:hypothetical protein
MPQDDLLPPTNIPDLSGLKAQAEWMALVRGLAGGGSSDYVAYTLQFNCVRLFDAAVLYYSIGRHCILQFHNRDTSQFGIGLVTEAASHFETCIWYLERFIKHARTIRSQPGAEQELKLIIDPKLAILEQSAESRITQLRHTIAHLERDARKGKLPRGANIALVPIKDGLSVAHHLIEWHELAHWISDAHDCIQYLARFKPRAPELGA